MLRKNTKNDGQWRSKSTIASIFLKTKEENKTDKTRATAKTNNVVKGFKNRDDCIFY